MVLLIYGQEAMKGIFERVLRDCVTIFSPDPGETASLVRKFSPDVVFVDMRFPQKSGVELLMEVLNEDPFIPVIGLTLYPNIPEAVEFIKKGGFDYLSVPFEPYTLRKLVTSAIKTGRNRAVPTAVTRFDRIVGRSRAIKQLKEKISKIAKTEATVLIVGETGVGKELTAKSIHESSHRSSGPFVVVDCAAIPSTLVESELFGAEKGAYTGAQATRKGLIEIAHGGTLFLDEIGELEMSAQSKLLRFLEEKTIRRVGGTKSIKVDARVIAATNKNLRDLVKKNKFREDLYYRLKTVVIHIPRLSERREDIPLLAHHFFSYFQKLYNRYDLKGFTEEAIEFLVNYDWKGNVRELRNCVEQAVILGEGPFLGLDAIREFIDSVEDAELDFQEDVPEDFSEYLNRRNRIIRELDRRFYSKLLEKYRGNISEISRKVGLSRKTLYQKLQEMGLK